MKSNNTLSVEDAERKVKFFFYNANAPEAYTAEELAGHKKSVEKIMTILYAALHQNNSDLKEKIGMLRQWLNEDRIKDAKSFVTNEELAVWLLD